MKSQKQSLFYRHWWILSYFLCLPYIQFSMIYQHEIVKSMIHIIITVSETKIQGCFSMSNMQQGNPFHKPNPMTKHLIYKQSRKRASNSNQNYSNGDYRQFDRNAYKARNDVGYYDLNTESQVSNQSYSEKLFQSPVFVPSAYYHIKKYKMERQASSFKKYLHNNQLKPFNYDPRKQQQNKESNKRQLKNPFHRKNLLTDQREADAEWEIRLSMIKCEENYLQQNQFTKYDRYDALKDQSSKKNSMGRSLINYLADSNKYSNAEEIANYQNPHFKPVYESIYNNLSHYQEKAYSLQRISSFSHAQVPAKQQSKNSININNQANIQNQPLIKNQIKVQQFHTQKGALQVIKLSSRKGKSFYLNKLGIQ